MGLTWLVRARGRARRRILLSILLTLTFITAIVSATVGYTQLAATQALRAAAAQPFTAESFLRVHTSVPDPADDAEAQAQQVSTLMDELGLGRGLQRSSSHFGPSLPLVPSAGTAVNLPADLAFVPVEIPVSDDGPDVDAQWRAFGNFTANSSGPVPAVLTADAAAALDLDLGQTFSVDGANSAVQLELTGVVDSSSVGDSRSVPLLAVSEAVAGDGGGTHAIAVPEGSLERFTASPKIQWTLTLDPHTISADHLNALAAGLPLLKDRMLEDEAVNDGGVVAAGGLSTAIATAAEATRAVQAIVPTSIIVLAALGLVGTARLAGLLAGSRTTESQLMRARGASSGQRTMLAAAEILPIALLGAAAGWAAALAVAPLLTRWTLSGGISPAPFWDRVIEAAVATWFIPLSVLVAAVVIFSGLAFVQAVRAGTRTSTRERIGSFVVVALLAGVCLLSVFQFLLHDSPLLAADTGQDRLNVLAAPAPALLILLLAVVGVLIVATLARFVEKRSGRRVGLGLFLAGRQVSRRMSLFVLPVVVIAVTVGTGMFAAAFTSSARSAQETAAQLVNGSDVRVQDSGPMVLRRASDMLDLEQFADIRGVSTADTVHRGEARAGTEDVAVVGVPAVSLPALVSTDADVFDAEQAAANIESPERPVPPALELNEQTSQVRFQLSTTSSGSNLPSVPGGSDSNTYRATITAWLERDDGVLLPVEAGTLNLTASGTEQLHSLAFSLPQNDDGTKFTAIAAVDIVVKSAGDPMDFTVQLTSIATDAGVGTGENRIDGEQDLVLAEEAFPESAAESVAGGAIAILRSSYDQGVPMSARFIAAGIAEDPLPVMATDSLLTALDLSLGESMPLRVGSSTIPALIVDSTQTIPGSGPGFAVLVDRGAYSEAWLKYLPNPPRANEIWIAAEPGADAGELADAVRTVAGADAHVSAASASSSNRFLVPATVALWMGALGALVIGAAALAASAAAMAAARTRDVSILRAVGVQAADQSRGRRRELAWAGASAMVLGAFAGLGTALLTVPALAGITLVDTAVSFAVPFGIAVVPALLLVAAQALVLGVAVWLYGRAVFRQSVDRAWMGELR